MQSTSEMNCLRTRLIRAIGAITIVIIDMVVRNRLGAVEAQKGRGAMDRDRALLVGIRFRSTVAGPNAEPPVHIFRVPRFELHQAAAAPMRK